MAGFVDFYNRNTRQVAAAVDQTDRLLRENMGPIDLLFPVVSYQQPELLLVKMTGDITVASLVGPDHELPNDDGQMTLTEELVGDLLIGKQHVFTKKEYKALRKMNLYLSQSGPQAQAVLDGYRQWLYGIAASMQPAVYAKLLILLMEVLTTGACDYTDPLTGVKAGITYNDKVNALFPAALTGNDRWQISASADGLSDLQTLSRAWYDVHGADPEWMLVHHNDLRNLAAQTATKSAYAAMGATDASLVTSVDIPVNKDPNTLELRPGPLLSLIQGRTGVQRVIIFDAKYTETLEGGGKRKASYLPDDYIVFGSSMGEYERALLPFEENGDQPGLYIATKELNDAPLRERLAGMTAGVPFVKDGRYLCAQKIDGAA